MNTCGTCKYFGPPVDQLARFDDDTCEPIPSKLHACGLLKIIRADEQDQLATPAAVVDGSGYFAALCVKEEFGCNQWAGR